MSSSAKSTEAPLAAGAGIDVAPTVPDDPYEALDDLMAVVEALCPVWPKRPPFAGGTKMVL